MILMESLVEGTSRKLRTFSQPDCFVYLKHEDVKWERDKVYLEWLRRYESMLRKSCLAVSFSLAVDEKT